ncbi:Lrp/AsnC family transcriptional regulator [Niastella caeni]|uniref:Lrp/AsnC family transcriptional regulator n=1 Tax=Niastella caeni TaxID=2569763 RepID=A0A4S8I070_9BACT|nr:Lrp/AsnC family transcriptional regulator [Niastella caeni]THU41483.1 Lrp/AsnC family transcriptional regulator [Niastella caeni]
MQSKTEQPDTAGITLDDKDFAILRLLQQNAKLTVREIAARIHLSATPVHERIKRMEANGVIKQYATLLDHRKVQKGIMVICYISLKEHNRKIAKVFIDAVTGFNEVLECYNISGQFDFMLKVVSENMETYHDFYLHKLSMIKGISQTQSIFVMGILKDTHQLL